MHVQKLKLKNYRNVDSLDLEFNPEFNFIFGKNAQGKTNLIESLYYLSELKSFRTSNRNELIKNGADHAKIQAVLKKDDLGWDIDITLSQQARQVLLNQKKPQNRKQYYELMPLILFEPRHIYLFRDSPASRRHYLNRALFIQDPGFLTLLRNYEKVIVQKNRLLKESRDPSLVSVWNDQLVDWGAQIIKKRLEWFYDIHQFLAGEYKALSNAREQLHLMYNPSQSLIEHTDTSHNLSLELIQKTLKEKLIEKQSKELERRESLVGPHRDDFTAFLGERAVGMYGSQGENRSTIIALKLSQLKLFASKYNKSPLFLLDDVASELDEDRCRYLFSYLQRESTQAFLTTTENHIHGSGFEGHSTHFMVENGVVGPI